MIQREIQSDKRISGNLSGSHIHDGLKRELLGISFLIADCRYSNDF